MNIDIVSDLHIDNWSHCYKTKYKKGRIDENPFQIKNSNADYLIVAGDISDNIHRSIEYLKQIPHKYKKILYVDGNHEHTDFYPDILENLYINKLIENTNIHYLSSKPFIIEDKVFIGVNGWWNFNNNNNEIVQKLLENNYVNYENFTINDKNKLIQNIIDNSKKDFDNLNNKINEFHLNQEIKEIIIITHTIPNNNFGHKYKNNSMDNNFPTQYNTNFNDLFISNKIKYWIFGHVHGSHDIKYNNIHFICNPRGCPSDYNRQSYSMKNITI